MHEYGIQINLWSRWVIDYMYPVNVLTVES
jgi:hypothetical protein